MSNVKVVGLSATPFTESHHYEKQFLEYQRFALYDSHMLGYIDPATAATKATLEEFFAKSDGLAKIVFAQGDEEQRFLAETERQPNETNCKELAQLRELNYSDLLLVTNAALMRGVDYRV